MNMAATQEQLQPSAPHALGAVPLARSCTLGPLESLPQGLDALSHSWRGHWRRWRGQRHEMLAQAQAVEQACLALQGHTREQLEHALQEARAALRRDPLQAQGQLNQALAVVGQIARRVLGMQPYAVQFMGALTIHEGLLAEMATGEGKTLTVGLSGVLAGLSGRPCHIITANDYLAERDAQEMHKLYAACGLSVQSITSQLEPQDRPVHYDADVVYLTAKELLADHLRDQIGPGSAAQLAQAAFQRWLSAGAHASFPLAPSGRLQVRGLHTALVDEIDSILIDEAVTPLILAVQRESKGLDQAVLAVSRLADSLQGGEDFECEFRSQAIVLKPPALAALQRLAPALPEVWRPAARREELLRQALLVRCFFKPGQQYVVQDGEVVLLDEFTGRMTPGRTLTSGLHQAIEAHQGLEITSPNESLTQMSFQAFFRRFRKLSGCTGTAWEAASEMWQVYGLQVRRIPTHRPRQTVYQPPELVLGESEKWDWVCRNVLEVHATGRPVLVGVRSVTASQALAERLVQSGCTASVLNALAHAQEAEIIAQAGQSGRITIATNMAGRGTDIRLGQGIAERGGLHVVIAEINESARIDRQLAGRCGRQGDPGSVATCLCLDDDLVRRHLPQVLRSALLRLAQHSRLRASQWARPWFRWVQRRAEQQAFQRRWSVLRSDDWMKSALPFGRAGDARAGGRT